MAIDADEEILQDFIIEAGEIIETLSEQLVALENEPENMDLLNAIFRGFHTVKGGAGFLNLTAMVEVCHITENIFDILRNGGRKANAELMDTVLRALDQINEMFDEVKQGDQPSSASSELLEELEVYAKPDDGSGTSAPAASQPEPKQEPQPTQETSASNSDEITDDEFEALLDQIHGSGGSKPAEPETPAPTSDSGNDEITDEEFEALLDELHGKDKPTASSSASSPAPPAAQPAGSDEAITDDEFEALLDQIHGSGKGPQGSGDSPGSSATDSDSSASDKSPEPEKPAEPPKPEPPKVEPPKPQPAASAPKEDKPKAQPKSVKAAGAMTGESTVRVDTARLDDIMNMVGELVLARNRLKMLGQNYQDEELNKAVATLDVVTSDLQGSVMKTRMQPIKKVFGRFPRVVRDLARNLKKEITLELVGEETDLDKNLVEALADPLVHLVRNSVDHGVESPEDRVAIGKPRTGKVVLSAAQEGDHILLAIEDDGKGMDPVALRNKAVQKGLMDSDQADRLSDTECFNLIFMAGFSTKEEISDVSGRGVGMDVVKTKITQLNGSLTIDSNLGLGTKILIKVPLTLAILPTLMVTVGKQVFALPLASVNEIFHLDLTKTNVVDGQETVIVRDKALPLFYLDQWLLAYNQRGNRKPEEGHVVIVQVGTHKIGFVVDSLIGQEEVVIKPLGKSLQGTPGMAGATITSDGGIALILDVPSLLKQYAKRG
ncbi:chemotaxis protein CheA [Pleionea sediminis]|uniref:chemotaxis protein CheA n=1 Tax=Pleionea sediminis TaxID=2569479 RepID=UPI001184785A|nr:chemotaxis protein CheA [Pleionea sediminis]